VVVNFALPPLLSTLLSTVFPAANVTGPVGVVSIQTTERYLEYKQRFRDAVSDHIGLETEAPS
jgi:hypothetical protein